MGALERPVLLVTEDHSPANTGVTTAVDQLSRFLAGAGANPVVLTVGSGTVEAAAGVSVRTTHRSLPAWRYAAGFGALLDVALAEGALVHAHGVWMHPQWAAARAANRRGVPFVLSPHNMLGGWLWRNGRSRIKKTLYWTTLAGAAFGRSACVHALSNIERDALAAKFFPGCRIEVIPNALRLEQVDAALAGVGDPPWPENYLLFLGRLHPVKGVDRLIDAFRRAMPASGAALLVAGPGTDDVYGSRLRRIVSRDRLLAGRVHFLGPVEGTRKWALLRHARALCAPSFSEGMSMVALEALAAGTPVLTSPGAGLPEVADGGGVVCDNDPTTLAAALAQVLAWDARELAQRRAAARRTAERYFSWSVVGPRYLELYASIGH